MIKLMHEIANGKKSRRRRSREYVLAKKREVNARYRVGKQMVGAFVTFDVVEELNYIRDSVGGDEGRAMLRDTLIAMIFRTAREIREGKLDPSVLAP